MLKEDNLKKYINSLSDEERLSLATSRYTPAEVLRALADVDNFRASDNEQVREMMSQNPNTLADVDEDVQSESRGR